MRQYRDEKRNRNYTAWTPTRNELAIAFAFGLPSNLIYYYYSHVKQQTGREVTYRKTFTYIYEYILYAFVLLCFCSDVCRGIFHPLLENGVLALS